MSWIVGKSKTPKEKAGILDNIGFVETDHDFIKAHPTWYVYTGTTTVNGHTYHCYRLNNQTVIT